MEFHQLFGGKYCLYLQLYLPLSLLSLLDRHMLDPEDGGWETLVNFYQTKRYCIPEPARTLNPRGRISLASVEPFQPLLPAA
jgi:hypothetical protein